MFVRSYVYYKTYTKPEIKDDIKINLEQKF